MALALAISLVLNLALIGGLAWFAITVEDGYSVVIVVAAFVVAGIALSSRSGARSGARAELEPSRERIEALVSRLSLSADVAPPRVEVEHNDAPLSWTTAGLLTRATIHATTGLSARLSEAQLAAVLAHELSHVTHRDARVMTIVGGPPTWILRGLRRLSLSYERWGEALFFRVVHGSYTLPLAAPSALAARVVSRHRELSADRGAALLTGAPAALGSALLELSGELDRVPKRDLRAAGGGDLFYVLPSRGDAKGLRRLWATHPPLTRRLEQLERMERALQGARPTPP
jgi:heat shock protein HtpX